MFDVPIRIQWSPYKDVANSNSFRYDQYQTSSYIRVKIGICTHVHCVVGQQSLLGCHKWIWTFSAKNKN